VRAAALDLPRAKDCLHQFMWRIDGVKAAMETAIAILDAGFGVLVVRLS
jgi:hypothetical protein